MRNLRFGDVCCVITYDPIYAYKCYISSFMKIERYIRNLKFEGGVGG